MQMLCRLIGHQRYKRGIPPWRESWQTECRICATRLVRVRHGKWVPLGPFVKDTAMCRAHHSTPAD